ncbi:MAG: tetratricopeptide repeat-containing sensor histidine kinase [Bacteroidetes bacterium]|nr:tetratricopeptide repeat-containing sensor histidine kinase [Bacteroidota bacterium]
MKIIASFFNSPFIFRNIFIYAPAITLFILTSHSNSAGQKSMESLHATLPESRGDSVTAKLLYRLCYENLYVNNNRALRYALELYRLSVKLDSKPWLCRAYFCLGSCLLKDGDYPKALRFTLAAIKLSDDIEDWNVEASALQRAAEIYFSMDRFREALENYNKCLQIAEKLNNANYLASTYCSLGASYLNLGMNDSALAALQKAMVIYKKMNDRANIAFVNANIGEVYKKWDSLQTAMNYYSEAINSIKNDSSGEAKDLQVFVYTSMGEVSGRMGNHKESLDYFNKGLELSEQISDKKWAKQKIYERMAAQYERAGDLKNSMVSYKLFHQLKDSLLNEKSMEQINNLQAKYESEKKDKKIKLLTKEKELEKTRARLQNIITWSVSGGAVSLIVIVILLFIGYRKKQRCNLVLEQKIRERTSELTVANQRLQESVEALVEKEKQLNQANSELNILLYRISHDLRAPLVSIMGLVNLYKTTENQDDRVQCIQMIDMSVQKMDIILKDLSTINVVREARLDIQPVNINVLTEDIFNIYSVRPDLSKLTLYKDIETGLTLNTDQGILHSLLQNLVDNGIKYRKLGLDDPMVRVNCSSRPGGITLVVEDNGIGMKPEIEEKAFDLFYRGSEEVQGSGLGLYLVKKAIESLKGTILVESRWAVGTKFEIFLPELKFI